MTDVVALAAELLAIQSTSGAEAGAVDFVSRWLVARGWNVELQEVAPGRANVWASRSGQGVTLSTHLDTVPPYVSPRLDGNRLYGRGACDAKGIAAAMMAAAEQLAEEGEHRVDLLFVVGEEKNSDGARAANHLPATSRWLINGEPTESKLASGAKGSQRVIVRTRGRAAHSAYAHLGPVGHRADAPAAADDPRSRPAVRPRARRHHAQHRHDSRRHRGQHRSRRCARRRSCSASWATWSRCAQRSTGGPTGAPSSSGARTSRRSAFTRSTGFETARRRVHVGHPAARPVGNAAPVRAGVDHRGPHARRVRRRRRTPRRRRRLRAHDARPPRSPDRPP